MFGLNLLAGPLGPMLSTLWKYKGQIITGLLVLGLCLYIMNLKSQIHTWQLNSTVNVSKVAEMTIELESVNASCKKNIDIQNSSISTLEASITRQNRAIKTLNDQLQVKNAEIAELKKRNEEERIALQQELNAMMLEAKPKDCASSIEYLINGKGDLTWKK